MSGGSTDPGCLTQPGCSPLGMGWGILRLPVPSLALGSWGGSGWPSPALWQGLCWLSLAAQLPRGYSVDGTVCPCNATTMLLSRHNITSCHSCSCKRGLEEEGPRVHIIRVQ